MKILSIDIGIKNLGYTLIDYNKENEKIILDKWEVVNLCNNTPLCCNNKCNRPAKFFKSNMFYCKQHTKNEDFFIPKIGRNKLSKQNTPTLINLANEYDISFNKKILKNDLVKLLNDYLDDKCFDVVENINANSINLIDLGVNIKNHFNELFKIDDIEKIDMILLENQISPIANRMKTIQGMIAQYFINKGNYNIEFISAANKLKLFIESKKTTYSERKKLSILYTKKFLTDKNLQENLNYFDKHTKKDDLADCLLQGIFYLATFNNLVI
jgi:hypothetical protein